CAWQLRSSNLNAEYCFTEKRCPASKFERHGTPDEIHGLPSSRKRMYLLKTIWVCANTCCSLLSRFISFSASSSSLRVLLAFNWAFSNNTLPTSVLRMKSE